MPLPQQQHPSFHDSYHSISGGGGGGGGRRQDGNGALSSSSSEPILEKLAHGPRTLVDEHFRAPIVWAYNLRETILEPRQNPKILRQRNWHVNEALKLLAISQDFITYFHALKVLIITPFPFPLVQVCIYEK